MYPECDLVMFYLKCFCIQDYFFLHVHVVIVFLFLFFFLHEDHDFLVMCESFTPQCRYIRICISSVLIFLYLFLSTSKALP